MTHAVDGTPKSEPSRLQTVVHTTLPELFARQVAATPDAVALVFDTKTLSYADLAGGVNRLAARLIACGAGPDRTVAVVAERSAELVIALLAVLRSGAAYLPVDPEHPDEHIAYLLDSTRPVCIVFAPNSEDRCRTVSGTYLTISTDEPESEASTVDDGEADAEGAPHPLDAAYVLYTSGSTGRPKGVVVSHLSIVNHLVWMRDEYGLSPHDRVLQKAPIGFDVSVWEIFLPLISGATLVLAGPSAHREPAELGELIRREQITMAHFVPSMLNPFLSEPAARRCDSLRIVISSGEALSRETVRRFFEVCGAELHNLYGPTEAAIDVTAWECHADDVARSRIPIGSPVAHTQTYVLDENLCPVPAGSVGELYLGGVQLARGYRAAPALTAERFVASPFSPGGERMYRTGDLVIRTAGGELDYVGRVDAQVKVNGVRIELGEVESALETHPCVSQAAAVAVHNSAGDTSLAAFVTVDADKAPILDRLLSLRALPDRERPLVEELSEGLPVCVAATAEARFMFREIFEQETYLRHGITLSGDGCVVDVGANIGLFSLYVSRRVPDKKIYAFEPSPDIFHILGLNARLHGINVQLYAEALAGVADEAAMFTFYPRTSLISGFYADAELDGEVLSAYVREELGDAGTSIDSDALADLVSDRLEAKQIPVPVRTLSQVVAEEGIRRISLLKIDVERSELDVLAGVDEGTWPLIDQIVLEVHNADGRVAIVERMLADHGFRSVSEPPPKGMSDLYTVYATRRTYDAAPESGRLPDARAVSAPLTPRAFVEDVRRRAAEVLPAAMVPAPISVVTRLPLTPNGKLDRRALEAHVPVTIAVAGRAPRTECETVVCRLVCEALGLGAVSLDDDLLALGSTSVTMVKLVAALNRTFSLSLRLRTVVRTTKIEALAEHVQAGIDLATGRARG